MKLTKEYLKEKYIEQRLSVSEVMNETGYSRGKVKGCLRRYGLRKSELKLGNNLFDSKEWLFDQYMVQKKGYTIIADECGVSYTTILDRILYFGWSIRGHKDIDKGMPRRGKKHSSESLELIRKTRVKRRVLITCGYCSTSIEIQKSRYKQANQHFCGYECFRKHQYENRVETEDITDSGSYKDWRLKVYKRDGYKCKMPNCNSNTKDIAAHHIYPKRDYPDKQFDVSNGITLCRTCHEKTYCKELQFIDALVRVIQKMND